jgi:hypothetical protein
VQASCATKRDKEICTADNSAIMGEKQYLYLQKNNQEAIMQGQ